MATYYTSETTSDEGYFVTRCKVDYSVTETATKATLSVTMTPQIKSNKYSGKKLTQTSAHLAVYRRDNPTTYSDYTTDISKEDLSEHTIVSSCSMNTWYSGTSLSGSVTYDKTTSTVTHAAYFYANFSSYDGSVSTQEQPNPTDQFMIGFFSVPPIYYTVSYNANGGTGTVSSQTKYHGSSLVLNVNSYSRTNYSFYHWNTSSDNSGTTYSAGGTYSADANAILYAIWNAIVSYNANGGSGAPSAQTKILGTNLTLSSTVPTRSGYSFKEWNTDSSGAGTSYQPGGTYSSDSPVTLYAIWKAVPVLTNLTAVRCDALGNTCEDQGYVKVTASYQSEYAITATSATVGSVSANGSSYPAGSGTISIIVGSSFLPLSQYGVSISATSEAGTSSANAVLSPSATYAMPTISNLVARRTTSSSSTAADAVGRYLVATFSASVHEEGSSSSENVGNVAVVFRFPGRQQTVAVSMSSSSQSLAAHSSQFSYYSDIGPGDAVPNVCTATLTDKFGYQTSVTVDLERSGYGYPSVSSVRAYRSNTSGVADDEGKTATVAATWSITSTPSQTSPSSLVLSAYDMSDILIARKTLSPSTTSGTTTYTFRGADRQDGLTSDNMFDVDEKYSIRVDVSDVYTSDYKSDILSTAYFTMDVLAGGHGVAFGKPSATAELLDVGYEIHSDVEVSADDEYGNHHKLTDKPSRSEVVLGVKGDNQLNYQEGYVSLSPSNIGAVSKSGDTMTGLLKFANDNALPNASTSTDFFATGINAFTNGGRLAYKGLADFKSWLGLGSNAYSSTSYLPLAGGTMTGGITCSTSGANLKYGNITIYGGGSNGGTNSMLVGDDVTIGDCNVGGCFGMKSTGTNAGFRFFNSSGSSIGGLQSTNGNLQWMTSGGTLVSLRAWTLLSSGTGTRSYNLGNYEEVKVVVKASNYTAEVSLPKAALTTSAQKVYTGGGMHNGTSNSGRGCELSMTLTSCSSTACNVDGSGVTATLYVYGR